MNWFKRMVIKWVRDDWNNTGISISEDCYPANKLSRGAAISTRDLNSDPALHFKVYNAIGGKVVEFSRYDRHSDRSHSDIYVIGKDEDFGAKIAKIAMLEVLKD